MKTIEDKALEWSGSHTYSAAQYEGFIGGYNMRDGESQHAIEVLKDLVDHYNEHGQILTWNVGIAIRALENLPQPSKND